MPKWSNDFVPLKYRYLQKRLDIINDFLKSLPTPSVDFFALSPKQRDLIEIYNRCLMQVIDSDNFDRYDQMSKDAKIEEQNRELIQKLNTILSKSEYAELAYILNNRSQITLKDNDFIYERTYPPHLIDFLSEQQDLYEWIPRPGRLFPSQLTWVAWDELLTLMTEHGYDINSDNISKLKPLKEWPITDKQKIVHLYLEMIDSKETRNKYLAVQRYDGDPPRLRKRPQPWNNERRYGFVNGMVVRLRNDE